MTEVAVDILARGALTVTVLGVVAHHALRHPWVRSAIDMLMGDGSR